VLEVLHLTGERPAHVDVLAQRLTVPFGKDVNAASVAELTKHAVSPVISLPPTLPQCDGAWAAYSEKGYGLSVEDLNAGRLAKQLEVRPLRGAAVRRGCLGQRVRLLGCF
jgi:hypothetical protein